MNTNIFFIIGVLTLSALATGCSPARAEVAVKQNADKSVTVATPVYKATLGADGSLTELAVQGAAALTHAFPRQNAGVAVEAPTVNVIGKTVAVRSGALRDEWTFGEDSVHILSEGYGFELLVAATVRKVIAPGGQSLNYTPEIAPGSSTGLVLANDLTAISSVPMHLHQTRWFTAIYSNGFGHAGQLVEFDLKLGGAAAGVELLSKFRIEGVGSDDAPLQQNGNRSAGITHFPAGVPIKLAGRVTNIGAADLDLEYRLSVVDHYAPWKGNEVFAGVQKASAKAAGDSEVQFTLPKLVPGFYYANLELWNAAGKVFSAKRTFAVDLPGYSHPLTRPADYKEFWNRRNEEVKNSRITATPVLISVADNANKAYLLEINGPQNSTIKALLNVGADVQPGKRVAAALNSDLTSSLNSAIEAARKPGASWSGISLALPLPGDATYSVWNSAQDNDLLDCVLLYLRGVDYLVSRPDVDPRGIHLTGASRSGPLAFITAAQRPSNVAAVAIHVPTSAGISWTDKPYYSWGLPNGYNTGDPADLAKLAPIAAYVDPVNHAPDVVAPLTIAYGIDDGLAQPQGIEAMYHLASSKWKRIARNSGGHQYSPEYQELQKELGALVNGGSTADNSAVLKQH